MPFVGLEKPSAAKVNRVQPVPYMAICDTNLTTTTSEQDISGASLTIDTVSNGAVFVAHGVFDCRATTGGAATIQGRLSVNGVAETAEALFFGGTTNERATISQIWRGTLATAGSHTIKLRGLKNAAAGTMVINAVHTVLIVTIYEVV